MSRLPFSTRALFAATTGTALGGLYSYNKINDNNSKNFFGNLLPLINNKSRHNLAFAAGSPSSPSSFGNDQIPEDFQAGGWVDGLPEYTLDEITERCGCPENKSKVKDADRIWIYFRSGVYDITDFLALHPGGGKRLMLAAGSGIEPFWKQFTIHDKAEVFWQLEKFRIGNLKGTKDQVFGPLRDPNAKEEEGGMWSGEPKIRDDTLKPFSNRPFNAQAAHETVSNSTVTPNCMFFVRNHLPVPEVDIDDFCLDISGVGMKNDNNSCPTLEQLKKQYVEDSQYVSIQCGGNRRAEAVAAYPEKPIKGIKWKSGAISTAKWGGCSMRQLLLDYAEDPAKLEEMAKTGKYHVHFEGADHDVAENYEISVPLELALDPDRDALVAWKMNGQPLPPDHGFPLRAVVPGTVGSRNCKWLSRISVQGEEALGDWQRRDYRNFSPDEVDARNWQKYKPINDTPVQAAITETAMLPNGKEAMIKGFAYCGGGKAVTKVEISYDGGKTFPSLACLTDGGINQKKGHRWAWKTFCSQINVEEMKSVQKMKKEEPLRVCIRATSEDGQVQPEKGAYNFRGMFYNGYSCTEFHSV